MQTFEYSAQDTTHILNDLKTREGGLSSAEVLQLRALHGENSLRANSVGAWGIFLRQFVSPFIYVLFFAALLSLFLGETYDGIIILAFILINVVISFFQEYHSERALAILNKYVVARAKVRRDGKELTVSSNELVP